MLCAADAVCAGADLLVLNAADQCNDCAIIALRRPLITNIGQTRRAGLPAKADGNADRPAEGNIQVARRARRVLISGNMLAEKDVQVTLTIVCLLLCATCT